MTLSVPSKKKLTVELYQSQHQIQLQVQLVVVQQLLLVRHNSAATQRLLQLCLDLSMMWIPVQSEKLNQIHQSQTKISILVWSYGELHLLSNSNTAQRQQRIVSS